MAIPQHERHILLLKSGGRCAFPTCKRPLTAEGISPDGPVILGEMAHIVAESPKGPRGNSPLTLEQRNKYENLIMLCNVHHQLIDDQEHTYTVDRLHQMKKDHEEWIEKTLNKGIANHFATEPVPQVTETVYSTLLPIQEMPRFVYGAQCSRTDESQMAKQVRFSERGELTPFIVRGGMLWAFQNLSHPNNPFCALIEPDTCERELVRDWWSDPDRARWFVDLTNRTLNKLTGRRGLLLDKRHHRYYFQPKEPGQELEIEYQPLNQHKTTRKVVWQPRNKKTGEGRGYWYHRAVALQFLRVGTSNWALNIRPEFHITIDGVKQPKSETIGSRVTRKKSRMFNYDLLGEIQFWRDFLGERKPRIILPFDRKQHIIISMNLMSGVVTWPGIPEEHAKPFKNIEYADDLLSWAELADLNDNDVDDADEWGDDDDELFSD